MIYKRDLKEMKMYSIEHYFTTIMQMTDEGHKGIASSMIDDLSNSQKKDMLDFMGKKLPVNPPINQLEVQQWIEQKLQN
jgi:hypothetical protein